MKHQTALIELFRAETVTGGRWPRLRTGRPRLTSFFRNRLGLASGSVAGGLVGLLLGEKKPVIRAQCALELGGLAVIAETAQAAWFGMRDRADPARIGDETGAFVPGTASAQRRLNRALLRAMIAAGKADGHIDLRERKRIESQLKVIMLDSDDERFVKAELAAPLDLEAVVDGVFTVQQASQLYLASLVASDPRLPRDRDHLAGLQSALDLDLPLVERLHSEARKLNLCGKERPVSSPVAWTSCRASSPSSATSSGPEGAQAP